MFWAAAFSRYVFFRWKNWQQNFLLLCGMSKISAGFCAIMQILLSLLVLPLKNWNFLYITANTGEYHRCSFFQEKNPGHFRTTCRPWRKYLQSKQKITLIPAINAMKVKFCTGVSLYFISSPKLFYHILGIFNLISKLYMGWLYWKKYVRL